MTKKQFGRAVKAERNRQQMTIRALAALVPCSESNIRLVERGGSYPSIQIADRILVALGRKLTIGHGRRLRLEPA